MPRVWIAIIGSVVLLVGLLWLLRGDGRNRATPSGGLPVQNSGAQSPRLHLLCAASNRTVVEAIARDYQVEYGVQLEIQFGPSQTLLSTAEINPAGDLFLPADDSYLELAREKNLLREVVPLARMRGVVAVRAGNPRGIGRFDDLLREDVRFVQALPEVAAVGMLTRAALRHSGLWDALDAHTLAYRTTVTDVANDVQVGSADAGIVYDAVLHGYPELEGISLPELNAVIADVSVGVLASSAQPARALHFAQYLGARDRGLVRYRAHGFAPVDGPAWTAAPLPAPPP